MRQFSSYVGSPVGFAAWLLVCAAACSVDRDPIAPNDGKKENPLDGTSGNGSDAGGVAGASGNGSPGSAGMNGSTGASGNSGTSGGTAGESGTGGGTSGGGAAGQSGTGGGSGSGGGASECGSETCNGVDDDCDGTIDEATDLPCYPDDTPGCTRLANGTYECVGLCAEGRQVCVNGRLSECLDFVLPRSEVCGGEEAQDENCNGEVDDGCPCSGNETQRCYTGRAFTAGVGICRAGEQRCINGTFGPCEGQVVPGVERCDNQGTDDNCNGIRDDVFLVGTPCFDFTQRGACQLGVNVCSGGGLVCDPTDPVPETRCDNQDEDCDGRVDETFDLQNDERNCGTCGMRCGNDQTCCNGSCVDTDRNNAHCGQCGNNCSGNRTCCNGDCVPTNTNMNCGGCGIVCGGGQACCGGSCVPTNTNANCGGCGNTCSGDEACCSGRCTTLGTTDNCSGCGDTCAGEASCCNGQCTPVDNDNCGGCGIVCGPPCSCTPAGDCIDAEGNFCI